MDKPVKCIGKWFDLSLKDRGNIKQLEEKVTEGSRTYIRPSYQEKLRRGCTNMATA